MKILMVCLGNICRSPLAEGILRHKVEQKNLNWKVASAGTGSWHVGEAPDPRSQNVAKKHGINISHLRAEKFSFHHFDEYDKIFTMDSSNYSDVIYLANTDEEKNKVEMIMNLINPGMNENIPDPYYNDELYDVVFNMLNAACEKIISEYSGREKTKAAQ